MIVLVIVLVIDGLRRKVVTGLNIVIAKSGKYYREFRRTRQESFNPTSKRTV